MSFLNSVLSSIGTGNRVPLALPRTAVKPNPPPTENDDSKSLPPSSHIVSGQKRKADDSSQQHSEKSLKLDTTVNATKSRSSTPPKSGTKYTGTARSPSSATPVTPQLSSASSAKPPKKGSYAEIQARALAARAAPSQIGMIKHKPKEKVSRKERLAQEAEAVRAAKESRHKKANDNVKALTNGRLQELGSIKKKQHPDLGYKGTARPKDTKATSTARARPELPAYKGTMNRNSSASSASTHDSATQRRSRATPSRSVDRSSRRHYNSYSDEDSEQEDYDSDSAMEAGLSDIDAEEEEALRAAKKEDEEELKKEQQAKAEKLARKRKLEQLVKQKRR